MTIPVTADHPAVVKKLSALDRLLPVWIGIAMIAGLLLGRWVPGLNTALESIQARQHFAADRTRVADHDVSRARQGALRPPRHRDR